MADVEASYSNRHAKQRTYQERLTTTLALYSVRTETHTACHIKLPQVSHYIQHTQKTCTSHEVPHSIRHARNAHVK